jgi:hypothetical protein
MMINTLLYGTIQSIKQKKLKYATLFEKVAIDGVIISKNRIVSENKPQDKFN